MQPLPQSSSKTFSHPQRKACIHSAIIPTIRPSVTPHFPSLQSLATTTGLLSLSPPICLFWISISHFILNIYLIIAFVSFLWFIELVCFSGPQAMPAALERIQRLQCWEPMYQVVWKKQLLDRTQLGSTCLGKVRRQVCQDFSGGLETFLCHRLLWWNSSPSSQINDLNKIKHEEVQRKPHTMRWSCKILNYLEIK